MNQDKSTAQQTPDPRMRKGSNARIRALSATGSSGRIVGLAFQGGSFLAGAIATGVVEGLLGRRAFDRYDINAFSGTSAGALVAAVCWRHCMQDRDLKPRQEQMLSAHETLLQQWLHNANGLIPNQTVGDWMKIVDHFWSLNPAYFEWKDRVSVPWLHREFASWVDAYVQPEASISLLYERYVRPAEQGGTVDLPAARANFENDAQRPRLIVGATRVVDSEAVQIGDRDFFVELLRVLAQPGVDREVAVRAAADYMRLGIMASGSLDFLNGMTTIENGRHAGTYLDGAWSENPPLKGLLDAGVDQIWMVEVFPKTCAEVPDTFAEREDRREELWQNAVVEQQAEFIKKVNLWIESGRLISEAGKLDALREDLRARLQEPMSEAGRRLLAAFRESDQHWRDCIDEGNRIVDMEALLGRLLKPYRHVGWARVKLSPQMQPLTAGARIVNDRRFLLDKIEVGRRMIEDFLSA